MAFNAGKLKPDFKASKPCLDILAVKVQPDLPGLLLRVGDVGAVFVLEGDHVVLAAAGLVVCGGQVGGHVHLLHHGVGAWSPRRAHWRGGPCWPLNWASAGLGVAVGL